MLACLLAGIGAVLAYHYTPPLTSFLGSKRSSTEEVDSNRLPVEHHPLGVHSDEDLKELEMSPNRGRSLGHGRRQRLSPPPPPAPSYPLQADPDCARAVDLSFVLDGSGSMLGKEGLLTNFVRSLAGQMTYGPPADTQVSVVMFSSDAVTITQPEMATTFAEVAAALPSYRTVEFTNIGAGLEMAKDIWDRAEAAGTYNGNQKVIVLISDGEQSPQFNGGPAGAVRTADAIKASGITIFAVGFGLVSSDTLRQLASSP